MQGELGIGHEGGIVIDAGMLEGIVNMADGNAPAAELVSHESVLKSVLGELVGEIYLVEQGFVKESVEGRKVVVRMGLPIA